MKWPTNEELAKMRHLVDVHGLVCFSVETVTPEAIGHSDPSACGRIVARDTFTGPKTDFDEAYADVRSRSTLIPWKKART